MVILVGEHFGEFDLLYSTIISKYIIPVLRTIIIFVDENCGGLVGRLVYVYLTGDQPCAVW